MGQGLQIWNASGVLTHDTADGIARSTGFSDVGPASYDGTPYTGTISIPGYASGDHVWYAIITAYGTGDPPNGGIFKSNFSVAAGVLSWEVFVQTRIYYGLY